MSAQRDQQVMGILAALAALVEPGQVVELRALNYGRNGTVSGYFDDLGALAKAAANLDNKTPHPSGIYVVVDPFPRSLLARAANNVKALGRNDQVTADADITRRRWFKIDADPIRPTGISATNEEHAAAMDRAATIRAWLSARGWPDPVAGDSGNGAHLLYRVDLPNDDASRDLVQRCLIALAEKFDDKQSKVDRSVFNAARIWKLYGTTARKGDDTDERPHRRARLLSAPEQPQVVTVDQLRGLADLAPAVTPAGKAAAKRARAADFWKAGTPDAVESWADGHGLTLGARRTNGDGCKWTVDCLTSPDHKDGAVLLLNGDGFLNYRCHHESCSGRGAADVFLRYPPPAGVAHRSGGGANGAGYRDGYAAATPDPADLDTNDRRAFEMPTINVSQQLSNIHADALAAINAANRAHPRQPVLLVRGGVLVRLKANEDGRTIAEPVTSNSLLNILANVADWVKNKGDLLDEGDEGDDEKHSVAHPPPNVVKTLLGAGAWPGLPVLDGIVYAPTFAKDGALHTEPGYDARTRLYNAGSVQLGDTTPTAANVRAALELVFGDLLVDFPFVDDASRAHALALFLLPFARRMVDGPTPLHMASAPAAGTGKSLMISMALYAALGEVPDPITSSPDPNEMDKVLTAKVIEGPPYMFIDNISGKLDSAPLASALTQTRFNRRLLGTNQTVSGKVDWVWAGTANNPTVSEELTRRSVLMRLDAGMEQPDRRTGFKHSDITAWAKARRADLVTAAITLVRNWQDNAAGRSWRERAKGSFEQWAEIMGGILDAAGVPGFLANDDQLREDAAPEVADLRAFVAAWAARFGQSPVTVKMLMPTASTTESVGQDVNDKPVMVKDGQDLLGALLGNGNERSRETRLGILLNEHKDRVFGAWRIVGGERNSRTNSRMWKVQPVQSGGDSAERRGTSRNVGATETANVPRLSTSGEIGFREETRNVAERLEQFNAKEEKTPSTDAHMHAHTRTCIENSAKRSATFRETSQNARSPEVDSRGTFGANDGQTFRDVPRNGGDVPRLGVDAYLGRALTPQELEHAVKAANVAGAAFRQLPAGGGMYKLIIDHMPAAAAIGDVDVI